MHVAPRIVNNVLFVSRINYQIHFSGQAQYFSVQAPYSVKCGMIAGAVGVKGN